MWKSSPEVWRGALAKAEPIIQHHAKIFEQVALNMYSVQPTQEEKPHIVDFMAVLIHAKVVTAGHSGGAITSHQTYTAFLLETEELAHKKPQQTAVSNRTNPQLQAQEVLQWAWLQQAKEALNKTNPSMKMPRGFLKAASGGRKALQKHSPNLQSPMKS